MFDSLVETIAEYPYIGIAMVFAICAIGLPLPEELVLIAAGYVCAKFPEKASLHWMMIWCATSIVSFDLVPYLLGRVFGARLLRIRWLRVIVTRRRLADFDRWFRKRGDLVIFFARFLAGIRTIAFFTAGVMKMLEVSQVPTAGKHAVVIGRSDIVGKPMAALLVQKGVDATVTICHSRTADIGAICRTADILIAAVGIPEFVKSDMIKPGAVVIDVGINRVNERLVGDVDFNAAMTVASAITPVPGGVGPMTIAMLLQNTLKSARQSAGRTSST